MATALRTQIYLTRDQRDRLDRIAGRDETTLAAVIRVAVDEYLARVVPDADQALETTFGAAPRFEVPARDEWDRGSR